MQIEKTLVIGTEFRGVQRSFPSVGVNSLKGNEKAKDPSVCQETEHKIGIYCKCKQVIA
jgi:hypothetical protein